MNVDEAVPPFLDKPGRQDAHESGEADNLNASFAQFRVQIFFKVLAVFVERMVDEACGHIHLARPFEPLRACLVGQDQNDLGRIVVMLGRVEQGLKV